MNEAAISFPTPPLLCGASASDRTAGCQPALVVWQEFPRLPKTSRVLREVLKRNRGKTPGAQVQHGVALRGEMAEIRYRCPKRNRNEA